MYLCSMQFARKLMVFAFACVIFTGTVGINVFAHLCKVDGVDYSYVVPSSHQCKTEVQEESCCHSYDEENHETAISSNCCKEEVSSFKITSEYIQKAFPGWAMEFIPVQSVQCIWIAETHPESDACVLGYDTRPPPKTGRDILVLNQVFRI